MKPTDPSGKQTIYVDVDDEITSIIDKIRAGDGRIVALVLPKRASVLQSVVNMKLLKRSAEQAKKQLVLITTEAGLLPLAGSVGVPVAATLQSKPEVPSAPSAGAGQQVEESLSLDDEPDEEFTADNAGNKSVGELAEKSGKSLVITSGVETETPIAAPAVEPETAAKPAKKHNKKLIVPNFNKFRLRLALIGLGVLLLIGFIYAAVAVWPKATVAISTNAQDVNSSIDFSLDTTASSLDVTRANVPATAVQQQKTYTKEVATTGEQNNGKAAEGSISISPICVQSAPQDIGQGTGVTANGKRYTTQESAHWHQGTIDWAHQCANYSVNKDIDIIALTGGTDHNVTNATFSIDGSSATATGSASGGTDDITKVVAQKDIDTAKGQVDTKDPAIKEALAQQLRQSKLFPIGSTFQASDPNTSSSAQPGDKADKVTVTISITYTMFGTARSNLVALVKDDVDQQVDTDKQAISDDGLDKANFSVTDLSDTKARITLETTATVGPKIDKEAIQKQIAGHKSGEAKDTINQLPGVTDVNIKLSPFWVSSIPSKTDRIVITVGKAASN